MVVTVVSFCFRSRGLDKKVEKEREEKKIKETKMVELEIMGHSKNFQ